MNINVSYQVKLLNHGSIIQETVNVYQKALAYVIDVVNKEWNSIASIYKKEKLKAQGFVEGLIHSVKKKAVKYDFDKLFVKYPSYLRRGTINAALGAVSSYRSNLKNWEENGKHGKEPTLTLKRRAMPTFYKDNTSNCNEMLQRNGNTVLLKLYNKKDWVWVPIRCRRQDVKYLNKWWTGIKASAPTLVHGHNCFYLRFLYVAKRDLKVIDPPKETILAVDLGINTDATCSVMTADGTVIARKFLDFPIEKDRLYHQLNRIKGLQRKHGPTGGRHEWKKVVRINEAHATRVANSIVTLAAMYDVDTIVFEYLDMKGKTYGPKKQRLHMWRKNSIQKMVEIKAHLNCIHVSHICAWNTSKLAYDGSGKVERGIKNDNQEPNYSLCKFTSGKMYNCDLNASYNIGARYFIRKMIYKTPELADKVPVASRRTYSDLKALLAA